MIGRSRRYWSCGNANGENADAQTIRERLYQEDTPEAQRHVECLKMTRFMVDTNGLSTVNISALRAYDEVANISGCFRSA